MLKKKFILGLPQNLEIPVESWKKPGFMEAGLAHTQGIQGNSGNFQVTENLRETRKF